MTPKAGSGIWRIGKTGQAKVTPTRARKCQRIAEIGARLRRRMEAGAGIRRQGQKFLKAAPHKAPAAASER